MKLRARGVLLTMVCGVLLALILPAAASAAEEAGIENFFAANCKVNTCKHVIGETEEEEIENAEAEGFRQAGGHPNFGITDFKTKTEGAFPNAAPAEAGSGGFVTHIRTDVAPGVATNPEAPEKCTNEEFGTEFEPAPGIHTGLFEAPECGSESLIGENKAIVWLGPEPSPKGGDLPLTGNVYNLVQFPGQASTFGVALPLPKALTEALLKIPTPQLYAHTIIEGNVEWGAQALGTEKADYHDYFEIVVSPSLPLISSRLVFNGRAGEEENEDFLRNPTSCNPPGPATTTKLKLEFLNGKKSTADYKAPLGSTGCNLVPFLPEFALTPNPATTDTPDGVSTTVTIPHQTEATEIDTSDVKEARVKLPEGMTLNPSAAKGLEACTPAQARIHSATFGTSCPTNSSLGTVTLEVPGLPPGSLTGNVFLGGPESGPITAPPYTIYVVANSEKYGVSVRVKAEVIPDLVTGQVTTVFNENPEQPFSSLQINFKTGALAPIANPLSCGTVLTAATFSPFSDPSKAATIGSPLTVGGCTATPPAFNPTQNSSNSSGNAGATTSFTLNMARNDGEQFIGSVKTVLPPGLVGKISLAERCGEPAASSETIACPSASQIGTATVLAGSGGEPYSFSGPVYLTGPYNGAPYGLSIKVPAIAGPFNLGTVVTRAGVNVETFTSQVVVESALPKIRAGVPLRIKRISVAVNKPGFMINPTNCSALQTVSTLGGYASLSPGGATASKVISSPFQVANCNALKFAPKFNANSNAKTSRTNGAALVTEVTQSSGQANIKSVKVQLPKQLPSRLTTLQKACTEQVFAINPLRCPSGAFVGGAVVHTPTLPQPLRGPAILVSHAGAAFPDLDLVVEDPNHLRVILVGNTNIKNNITTTTFASTPDVPISSVRVELPTGSHSALAAFGNICAKSLVMPTTMTAQNGKTFKQNTIINVAGCPVEIVGKKVVGNEAWVTVRVPAAGRVSGSGANLVTVHKSAKKAHQNVTLKIPLTSSGRSKKPLTVQVRVGFVPKKGKHSSASTKVKFG